MNERHLPGRWDRRPACRPQNVVMELTNQLLTRPANHARGGGVGEGDKTLAINAENTFAGRVKDQFVLAGQAIQLFLTLLKQEIGPVLLFVDVNVLQSSLGSDLGKLLGGAGQHGGIMQGRADLDVHYGGEFLDLLVQRLQELLQLLSIQVETLVGQLEQFLNQRGFPWGELKVAD